MRIGRRDEEGVKGVHGGDVLIMYGEDEIRVEERGGWDAIRGEGHVLIKRWMGKGKGKEREERERCW